MERKKGGKKFSWKEEMTLYLISRWIIYYTAAKNEKHWGTFSEWYVLYTEM